MQIQIYHLQNSRSQRIVWLCEELNLDYELIMFTEHIQEQHSHNHPHPFKKFPTVAFRQNEQEDFSILTESSAIADFLCHLQNKLNVNVCADLKEIEYFYYWKNFADASFMPNLALKQIFAQIVQHTPFPVRFISKFFKYGFDRAYLNAALQQQMQFIDQHLQQHTWMSGTQFSSADILMWFPLSACIQLNPTLQNFKNINRYLLQIENRPAFQTACLKGQWSTSVFAQYWQKTD